jgi:hypothetical protein
MKNLIVRRFDQDTVLRAADHVMQIAPGRHHRVYAVFLLDPEVDENGAFSLPGRTHRRLDL